uniref:Transmembrane protein n=1 Tax=Fagus sylvatica TaxID=28930 RepID=A0A2N9IP36_FAGSY
MKLLNCVSLRDSFHILTITLLSLLLPLSFLLLARFSSAYYVLSLNSNPSLHLSSFLSFILYSNPSVLYVLVSIVSIATSYSWLNRVVVKPVVDDTVFGNAREERWVGRVAMAASFGTLWWWKLRDEVETLVVVAEVKRELSMGLGVADFVGWWLYYLIVTIGMVRIVKGLMWLGLLWLCRKVRDNSAESCGDEDKV